MSGWALPLRALPSRGFLEFFVVRGRKRSADRTWRLRACCGCLRRIRRRYNPIRHSRRPRREYLPYRERAVVCHRTMFRRCIAYSGQLLRGFSEQAVDAAFVHFVRCHDEFDRGVIRLSGGSEVFVRPRSSRRSTDGCRL